MAEELPDFIKELSPSKIGMFRRCPFQYQLRYCENLKIPPASALAWGSSSHTALEHNYREKVKSKMDVPVGTLTDVFVESWRTYKAEVALEEGENFDKLENEGIDMMKAYHSEVAPSVMPRLVEIASYVPLTPQINLSVKIDMVTMDEVIKDHKTSKKSPAKNALEKDMQVSSYWFTYQQQEGKDPAGAEWDWLVRTKKPKFVSLQATRTPRAIERFKNICEVTARQITACYKAGAFPPNEDSWVCSYNYCGYWRICHSRF